MPNEALISRVMLDAIDKQVVRQGSFFRDKFFSTVETVPTTLFEYDEVDDDTGILPFAGYNAESTSGTMRGYANKTGRVECIRHKYVLTPMELEQRLPGRTVYDSADKIAELQNLTFGDLERKLIRTEESLAVQALTTGQVKVRLEDGSERVLATYWDTPVTGGVNDPVVTAGSVWGSSTTGADMLEQILTWRNAVIQHGGSVPSTLVVAADLGAKLARALMATPTSLLNPGAIDAGASYDVEGIQYLGTFAGLAIYASGAAVGGSPLLANGTALLGSGMTSKMMYGPTFLPTFDAMSKVVSRRTMYTDVSRDPVAFANIIQSAPLPLVRRKWDVLYIKGLSS